LQEGGRVIDHSRGSKQPLVVSAPLLGSLASTTMFIAFTSADVTRMGGIWLRYEEREHASFCEAIESHHYRSARFSARHSHGGWQRCA
jgi:hypothetical protein